MARKMPISKAAGVLLVLCLLLGAGRAGVGAETRPGVQLVVILDSVNSTADSQMTPLWSQGAGILVHLLGAQNYLGLVSSDDPDAVLLPPAELSPKHREQALETLAHFAPRPQLSSPQEVMEHALDAFQPQGPQRRVLFWLGRGEGLFDDDRQDEGEPRSFDQIADQARSAGVTIFAATTAPEAGWQTLTARTGGQIWKIKTASDLRVSCLKLYQYLAQPQEAPLEGSQVRLDKWVKHAVLVLIRSDPKKGVVLTNPRKARFTRRTRTKNLRWVAGRSYDLITLTRPRPGVWSFTGARSEDCKVFLSSELTLSAAKTPWEVAADAALPVSAVLEHKGAPADADLVAGTKFSAELKIHDTLLTVDLKAPQPGQGPELPAGERIGRLPPVHQEGQGTLRLWARGKNFQRLRELPLTITQPWYRVTEAAPVKLPVHVKPNPGRRPDRVAGAVTLKSALGSLSSVFIDPNPGSEIVLARSPGSDDFCRVDLHLEGIAPDGRRLAITTGPLRLQTSQRVTGNPTKPPALPDSSGKNQRENSWSLTRQLWGQWIWLALCAVGGVIILVSAFLLWRLRAEAENFEDAQGAGGSAPVSALRLKAQVESLTKERAELEMALKGKNQQNSQLQTEKAELEAALERTKQKSQANLKAVQDLEKKLQETEEEAQRVKTEYMALYARNQREQETLKKN